ncbi:hypothetical protein AB0O87_14210 [Microbacterium sp. NPDC076768]|uniref:hypothetical protein n=1 Tax=Microbacterium sp. NPDC076768 TaxID=3154858 RepID=UPI00341FBBFB
MIVAGFILLAVGAADLVRQFAPRRWIGYLTVAVTLLLLGSVGDALLPMLISLVVGALWVWGMPADRPAPLGFWPAVLLGVLCIGAVVFVEARADAGLIGSVWQLRSPFGEVPFDLAMLTLGAGVFLLESSNLVVRAALDGEHTWRPTLSPDESAAPKSAATDEPAVADTGDGFKGGRLIGPLERILVLILTLAMAYPILAAMLAAKGIVRFPEISRDGKTGARAEYFLVGSLVSWVIALGSAFLVWWAAHS